jgi:hypothetical protein
MLSVASIAQSRSGSHGFYLNPNFNHVSYRNTFMHHGVNYQPKMLFTPNLTLGYMAGRKNRHNISLTALDGRFDHYTRNFTTELRYQYDILTFRKNKFSFYTSPYIRGRFYYFNNSFATVNGRSTDEHTLSTIAAGVAPVFEYKLGKRIDFVASLPLEIGQLSQATSTYTNDNQTTYMQRNYSSILRQGEARIGLRLNLFRK